MKEAIFTFAIAFVAIYLVYLIFVVLRKKTLRKIKNTTEIQFIKKKYNLKLENVDNKKIALDVAFCNSLIISFTLAVVTFIKYFILQVLVGFVLLILLILIVYSILGKEYKRRENKNV